MRRQAASEKWARFLSGHKDWLVREGVDKAVGQAMANCGPGAEEEPMEGEGEGEEEEEMWEEEEPQDDDLDDDDDDDERKPALPTGPRPQPKCPKWCYL